MAEKEIELCFFAEVTKKEGYDQAQAVEQHDQYEFRLPPGQEGQRRGRVRVRKTVKNGEVRYQETIKTPIDPTSTLGDSEETIDITEAYYNTWLKTFATKGQRKTRYTYLANSVKMTVNGNQIELPKLVFEVDRFYNTQGQKSQWVKIDVEVQDIIAVLKANHEDIKHAQFAIDFGCLPLGITKFIDAATKDANERAGIENFFDVFSVTPQTA